jgi:HD-GYP domain-containing protein (c-di-GMP phosphodiesterase class II)
VMREAISPACECLSVFTFVERWLARMRVEHLPTYEHAVASATFLVAFGRQLKHPREALLELALIGFLFDIGKLKLPRALLDQPQALKLEQLQQVERHVDAAVTMLVQANDPVPAGVIQAIVQHHERMDGTGYPNRLPPARITVPGHMTAIVDTFVAMTRPRPYSPPQSPLSALLEMHFSPERFMPSLVEQFCQAIGLFPVGSLVELSTGEVSIVAQHHEKHRMKPEVLIVTGPDKVKSAFPYQLNLAADPKAAGRAVTIIRALPKGSYGIDSRDFYGDNH